MKTCKKHHRTFSYGNCPSCEDEARTAHRASEDSSTPFVMPSFDYGSSSSSYDSPASDASSSSSDFGGGGGFDGGGGGSDF